MSAQLNKLFEQIFRLEKHSRDRIDYLRNLGSRIQLCQIELQQAVSEAHSMEGELAVRNNKLFDVEVDVQFFNICEGIQQDASQSIRKLNTQLATELETKRIEHEALQKDSLEQLMKFSGSYDLRTSGLVSRLEDTKAEISVLKEEKLLIKAELLELSGQRKIFEGVNMQICKLQKKLLQEKNRQTELLNVKQKQSLEIENLNKQKCQRQDYSNESEFVRLQKELDSTKQCAEELMCVRLQQQLEKLESQCYHKQMKQHVHNAVLPLKSGHNPGHYNPYTYKYVPVANIVSPPCSITTSDLDVDSVCVEKSPIDNCNEDELLPENCLDDCEDDFLISDFGVLDGEKTEVKSKQKQQEGEEQGILENTSNCAKQNLKLSSYKKHVLQSHFIHKSPSTNTSLLQMANSKKPSILYEVISPDPSLVSKKKPGQSIYKTPGTQENVRLVKRSKKVRFNY